MPDGFRLETPASVMRLSARPVGAQSDKLTPLAARMRLAVLPTRAVPDWQHVHAELRRRSVSPGVLF
jgi:hypothetical protein